MMPDLLLNNFLLCFKGVNNAKTCLKHLQELDAKPKLLGAFRPVCQANGLYAETQCHGKYYLFKGLTTFLDDVEGILYSSKILFNLEDFAQPIALCGK